MRSKLKEIVLSMAKKREIQITSFREQRINALERDFNDKKIKLEEVLLKIRDEFSYHFEEKDYKEIEKELEKNTRYQ